MPIPAINVAIVDDHTLFRKTLKAYITEQRNLNVVISSPDVPDLLNKLKDFTVHVLIMDVYMPKVSGNEAVNLIRSKYPDIKILVLSMCTDMDLLSDMLDAGVYSIISKADEPEELIRAITSLSEQRIYRNKMFTDLMYWNKQNTIKTYSYLRPIALNDREKEILGLLWEEKSNKEIADHLFLSIRSIEKIRQDLKEKIGVKSTIGLLKYAIEKKIIILNPWHLNVKNGDNGYSLIQ
ncbi:DNA-binding response regulator [Niastella yeongjuensis]|uniref:DNA-binding response regulator n=1 Tax=Niastella yeongjuensis TaxID=354355 RepID=A0A1V9F7I5_9BACT|nr:response regulator transcription factor [Niastella yeongjuensis]OQP54231.1 DNA-binding response regulator [Niastella yeongjuensis]SEP31591.1 two component transcriptional regulator, LuxR family [Niastella yeongjuensis]